MQRQEPEPTFYVEVVVFDEDISSCLVRENEDTITYEIETTTVKVPFKPGWCDICWDVHEQDYCPEDVVEAQFKLLEGK